MPARDPNYRPPPAPELKCLSCDTPLPRGRAGKCDPCANPPIAHSGSGVDLPPGDAIKDALDKARRSGK